MNLRILTLKTIDKFRLICLCIATIALVLTMFASQNLLNISAQTKIDDTSKTSASVQTNKIDNPYGEKREIKELTDKFVTNKSPDDLEKNVEVVVGLKDDTYEPLDGDKARDDKRKEKYSNAAENYLKSNKTIKSGGKIEGSPTLSAVLKAKDLKSLQDDPKVAFVEENKVFHSLGTSPHVLPSAGISPKDLWAPNGTLTPGNTGKDQVIVVIDNGVDDTHELLTGKVVYGACVSVQSSIAGDYIDGCGTTSPTPDTVNVAIGGTATPTNVNSPQNKTERYSGWGIGRPCAPFVPANGNPVPILCDHGTQVAGVAAGKYISNPLVGDPFSGAAPEAKIASIRVGAYSTNPDKCDAVTPAPCWVYRTDMLVAALNIVPSIQGLLNLLPSPKPQVASVVMSLGVKTTAISNTYCDTTEPSIKGKIDALFRLNIPVVIASGNDEQTRQISSPACISSAISVGSVGDGGSYIKVSNLSNNSKQLDFLAPGFNIRTAQSVQTTTGNFQSGTPPSGVIPEYNARGTSFAAPYVAAAYAILHQAEPSSRIEKFTNILKQTSDYILDDRTAVAPGQSAYPRPGTYDDHYFNSKPRVNIKKAANFMLQNGGAQIFESYSSFDTPVRFTTKLGIASYPKDVNGNYNRIFQQNINLDQDFDANDGPTPLAAVSGGTIYNAISNDDIDGDGNNDVIINLKRVGNITPNVINETLNQVAPSFAGFKEKNRVGIYFMNSQGNPIRHKIYPDAGTDWTPMGLMDVNLDGLKDLVFKTTKPNLNQNVIKTKTWLLDQDGEFLHNPGSPIPTSPVVAPFSPPVYLGGGSILSKFPGRIYIKDMNGDGYRDFVFQKDPLSDTAAALAGIDTASMEIRYLVPGVASNVVSIVASPNTTSVPLAVGDAPDVGRFRRDVGFVLKEPAISFEDINQDGISDISIASKVDDPSSSDPTKLLQNFSYYLGKLTGDTGLSQVYDKIGNTIAFDYKVDAIQDMNFDSVPDSIYASSEGFSTGVDSRVIFFQRYNPNNPNGNQIIFNANDQTSMNMSPRYIAENLNNYRRYEQ